MFCSLAAAYRLDRSYVNRFYYHFQGSKTEIKFVKIYSLNQKYFLDI